MTRRRNDNVVILSESAYSNLLENLYVRSSFKNHERLERSIQQLKRNEGKVRELVEE